jgi:hypothetical protein
MTNDPRLRSAQRNALFCAERGESFADDSDHGEEDGADFDSDSDSDTERAKALSLAENNADPLAQAIRNSLAEAGTR